MAPSAARSMTLFMTKLPKRGRGRVPLGADASLSRSVLSVSHHRTVRQAGQGVAVVATDAQNAAIGEEFPARPKAHGRKPPPAELKADTRVTGAGRNPHAHPGYVNTPVYHAST